MNVIEERQRRRNAESRDRWDTFAAHRTRVTELLCEAPGSALCVLGAGNSNDLDLRRLLGSFQEIDLVDLDAEALQHGITHQQITSADSVRLIGGVDLTAIADRLSASRKDLGGEEVKECQRRISESRVELPRLYSTVASVCTLSQLMEAVDLAFDQQDPEALSLKMSIRHHHLTTMLQCLEPGGTAILIADFVSSATFPELAEVPQSELMDTALELINSGNFFTGMNPAAIAHQFQSAPEIKGRVAKVSVSEPWLWDLGPRTYLVAGITARTHS